MFRRTITFLLIFMVLNHDFVATRSIDFPLVSTFRNVKQPHPDTSDLNEDLEWLDSESDTNKKYLEGLKTPAEIVMEVKRTDVTKDMVPNIVGPYPPRRITPKSIEETCHLYCLYQPVPVIVRTVALLQHQVIKILKTCPICRVTEHRRTKICKLYCQGKAGTAIEKEVKLPLPTVESVIAKNCSRCQIYDPAVKNMICTSYKCSGHSVTKLAKDNTISVADVNGILPECNTLVPDCIAVITESEKSKIFQLDCLAIPPYLISTIVGVTMPVVGQYLRFIKGKTCPPGSIRQKSTG